MFFPFIYHFDIIFLGILWVFQGFTMAAIRRLFVFRGFCGLARKRTGPFSAKATKATTPRTWASRDFRRRTTRLPQRSHWTIIYYYY